MDEFSRKKFGERLHQIRIDKGYARQQNLFCNHFNLNSSEWGALVSGKKREMYVSHLAYYAQQLDVSPTWLMFGIGPKYLTTMSVTDDAPVDLDQLIERVTEELWHLNPRERTLKKQRWYERLFGDSEDVKATRKTKDAAPNPDTTPSGGDTGGDKKGVGVLGANPRRKAKRS